VLVACVARAPSPATGSPFQSTGLYA
jgi:hypothetical protein